MTAAESLSTSAQARSTSAEADPVRLWWRVKDWLVFGLTMLLLGVLYGALYHTQWVRGGDSEVYLSIARNLARGEGYTYNGQPVGLVPPLWPVILSGAMWVTDSFAWLKLLMPALMLAYLGSAYWVLRRITGPWLSAITVLLVGGFQSSITLTMWSHSDPAFLALSWAGLLLALQAADRQEAGRRWWPHAAGAALLLCFAVATRWQGILWWPMIAAGVLHKRPIGGLLKDLASSLGPRRRFEPMLLAAPVSGLLAAGTFFALRLWTQVDLADLDPRYPTFMAGNYNLVNQEDSPNVVTHVRRVLNGPQWLSVLYWNQIGRSKPYSYYGFWLALTTVVPLTIAGLVGLSRRHWLWLGVAGAWLPVMATWPHAIDRYSLPVAPMLVAGTILGTLWLSRGLDARRPAWPWMLRRIPIWLMLPAAAVSLGYNTGAYLMFEWTTRDHLARYDGGMQQSLNRIASYLRSQSSPGGEIGVMRYDVPERRLVGVDLEERVRMSRNLGRTVTFTADHAVIELAVISTFGPHDPALLEQLHRRNIRWLVAQPYRRLFAEQLHGAPWRRVESIGQEQLDAQLWEVLPDSLRRVDVSDQPAQVKRVPGLGR